MAEEIRYLNSTATGNNDGTTLADAYTSWAAWISGEAKDLPSTGDWHHAYVVGGSFGALELTGWATGPDNYIFIEAYSGQEAVKQGIDAARAIITSNTGDCINIKEDYVRIKGLQIENDTYDGIVVSTVTAANDIRIDNCYIKGAGNGTEVGIKVEDADSVVSINNTIITGQNYDGINVTNCASVDIDHCVVKGSGYDGIEFDAGTGTITNTAVFDTTSDMDFDIAGGASVIITNCASDDGGGTHPVAPLLGYWGSEFFDPDNGDFSLYTTGNLYHAGVATSLATDIDGDAYDVSTPSIGADEGTSGGGGGGGDTWYVDSVNGNDSTGDGSEGSPWQTLDHALTEAVSTDEVILEDGHYGLLSKTSTYGFTDYVTVKARNEGLAEMYGINLTYSGNAYLRFEGIYIQPEYVDPGATDPQDPDSTQTTYSKSATGILISGASYFQAYNCEIEGYNKYLCPYGVSIITGSKILIEHCEIHKVVTPIIWATATTDLTIKQNHMYEHAASGLRHGYDSENIIVELNNIHDANYDLTDDYCPKADGANYHGSALAMFAGSIIIRKNIFHDGWGSAGIMFYDDAPTVVFSAITIENNLLYDLHTTNALRMYSVGENVVIRNNTIIGYYRDTASAPYAYYANFSLVNMATGFTADEIVVSNNLLLGIAALYDGATLVDENNNIFYALMNDSSTFLDESDITTTSDIVLKSGTVPPYNSTFEAEMFNGYMNFNESHGLTLDFTLKDSAIAVNFGDATLQPTESLGAISASGFILDNGGTRDELHTDIGCYSTFNAPVQPSESINDATAPWATSGYWNDLEATICSEDSNILTMTKTASNPNPIWFWNDL